MGKTISTFCFSESEVRIEKEIRDLDPREISKQAKKKPKSVKPNQNDLFDSSPDQTLLTFNQDMKKHIDSIKDLKDDLLKADSSQTESNETLDGSFTLIINKRTPTGKDSQVESSPNGRFEFVGDQPTTQVNEDDLEDFLQPKQTALGSYNNSLVGEQKMLSAIKETSEQSDMSCSRQDPQGSGHAKNKFSGLAKEGDACLKQQLKEIEELNLLQVNDSFEIAEDEDTFENSSAEAEEEKQVCQPKAYLEDTLGERDSRQGKSDFEYFCSNQAKRLTLELEKKPKLRQLINQGRSQSHRLAQKAKCNEQRKSARKSAHNEIKMLIQKITEQKKNSKNEKENRTQLNEEYAKADTFKRKSKQLLTKINRRVSERVHEGSEVHRVLVTEVERFYGELIARNLEELCAEERA